MVPVQFESAHADRRARRLRMGWKVSK